MKKKGLIISTVVMVVVLIASLTTATYAWFTTAASVQVNPINLEVKSNANVQAGVKADPSATTTGYPAYLKEDVNVPTGHNSNSVKWEGPSQGLGSELTFTDLKLGGSRAVGIGVPKTETAGGTVTDVVNILSRELSTGEKIVVAEGKGPASDKIDPSTVEEAITNVDYLDATIGVEANKPNTVEGLYVKVVVKTTDASVSLGVCASIHFLIKVGDNEVIDFQPFDVDGATGNQNTTKDTPKNATTAGYFDYVEVPTDAANQLQSTFYFWVATKDGGFFGTNGSEIKDFRILAYIAGADTDCAELVTGGCEIQITFDGTQDITKILNADGSAYETIPSGTKFLNTTDSVAVTA